MSDLQDILRKVQALIVQADHPNTGPAEAETFRAKAEALMFKYRIDEAQLSAAEKAQMGVTVQWGTVDLCEASSEYRWNYDGIMRQVLIHMDIRGTSAHVMDDATGRDHLVYNIVGYESDILFAQALYASARLGFASRMEPKYDPSLSDQVNAYRMRSAGMEGWRIAEAIYGKDAPKSARPKVRKMFADESIARGEDPKVLLGQGSNMETFRASYAQGFVEIITTRLRMMRQARGAISADLVLANRKEAIDEAFYQRYEYMRPLPPEQIADLWKNDPCKKCERSQSGHCRDHPKPRKGRTRYLNMDAYRRGQDAARTVDLGSHGRQVES